LRSINFDLRNTVFTYIPNTAETAFYGMMAGVEDYLIRKQKDIILDNKPSIDSVEDLISFRPRIEKLVLKDVKLRTFITDDEHRDEMVAHVYDTTYEVIKKGKDTIVVMDDSIVRGTTLEKSILRMLDRLEPKKIVIVSSAPQIRFPDCYGIDMSKMREFVAFRAMIELLKDRGKDYMLGEVYEKCTRARGHQTQVNYVKQLYEQFTDEEISAKISEIVRPADMRAELQVVFQTVDNLHKAIPHHSGDWYFTGNYPTPGGMKVVNRSYVNYMEGRLVRAY
jgi:amidophosphoribosyltransferase